jgi:putative FmdB family regulatory protein
MRIFDFCCAACGSYFEVFVRSESDGQHCPQCGSAAVERQQVTQMALRTSKTRRGRTIDLSSNACPCGSASHRHAERRG